VITKPGPIRVVLTRGTVESVHDVDVVISDAQGASEVWGDAARAVMPRSAIKPLQVVPLVRSGAAAAFDLTDSEIALGAASHSAEPDHIAAVHGWLDRIGLDAELLECGPSRPFSDDEADRLIAQGQTFGAVHNCCSGKHVGFLAEALHLGIDPTGYIERDHDVQRLVTSAIEEFTGVDLSQAVPGIDGCGIPTFALPLDKLALGMARLVTPAELDTDTAGAAQRVTAALAANPWWVSGTGRTEETLTNAAAEPVILKTGAEGVFTGALPERQIGIALKVRDGATRAANASIAAVLEHLGVVPEGHSTSETTNRAGMVVGDLSVTLP
jgi:L-asparaginase II